MLVVICIEVKERIKFIITLFISHVSLISVPLTLSIISVCINTCQCFVIYSPLHHAILSMATERVKFRESRYIIVVLDKEARRIQVRSTGNELLRVLDLRSMQEIIVRHLQDFSSIVVSIAHHYDLVSKSLVTQLHAVVTECLPDCLHLDSQMSSLQLIMSPY